MSLPLNPRMAATFPPPVMEARRWLSGVEFPADRPLINVSQAAPVEPPPEPLRRAIAEASLNDPAAHLYGPVLGMPELREEIAMQWSAAYGGEIRPSQVAITQGCNQAFTAILSTLAGEGDEVILPTPWYFNHKMWLDMQGVRAVPLGCGQGMVPDPEAAAAAMPPSARPPMRAAVSPEFQCRARPGAAIVTASAPASASLTNVARIDAPGR